MHAALTIDHSEAVPKYLVTPEIDGVPAPTLLIDGESVAGTDYVPRYALVAVNAPDDVVAGQRLMAGYPDVLMVQPGETLEISSDTAITSVYVIGVTVGAGGAAVDIDTFTDYACLIGRGDTDEADWIAQMKQFEFALVDDVRRVSVTLTDALDTNIKMLKIEGASYA